MRFLTIRRTLATAALCGVLGGCAAERATYSIAQQTKAIGLALVEKVPIDAGQLIARGKIENPHYTVEVKWVTGIEMDIGLDGIELSGEASGTGRGEDRPLSAASRAAVRKLLTDPYWADRLPSELLDTGRAMLDKAGVTEPVGPPAPPTTQPVR